MAMGYRRWRGDLPYGEAAPSAMAVAVPRTAAAATQVQRVARIPARAVAPFDAAGDDGPKVMVRLERSLGTATQGIDIVALPAGIAAPVPGDDALHGLRAGVRGNRRRQEPPADRQQ